MRENRHRRPVLIKCLSARGLKLNILPSEKKCIILKVTACITPLFSTAESDKQRVAGTQPGTARRLRRARHSLSHTHVYLLLTEPDDALKDHQAEEPSKQAEQFILILILFSYDYYIRLNTVIVYNPVICSQRSLINHNAFIRFTNS